LKKCKKRWLVFSIRRFFAAFFLSASHIPSKSSKKTAKLCAEIF